MIYLIFSKSIGIKLLIYRKSIAKVPRVEPIKPPIKFLNILDPLSSIFLLFTLSKSGVSTTFKR